MNAACERWVTASDTHAGGEVAEALREVEEKARRAHVGMWRYGDPGEDSDQVGAGPAVNSEAVHSCSAFLQLPHTSGLASKHRY